MEMRRHNVSIDPITGEGELVLKEYTLEKPLRVSRIDVVPSQNAKLVQVTNGVRIVFSPWSLCLDPLVWHPDMMLRVKVHSEEREGHVQVHLYTKEVG